MILKGHEVQNNEVNIINNEEVENRKNNKETQEILFKLINQIIIGTFTSYEEEKRNFALITFISFRYQRFIL